MWTLSLNGAKAAVAAKVKSQLVDSGLDADVGNFVIGQIGKVADADGLHVMVAGASGSAPGSINSMSIIPFTPANAVPAKSPESPAAT